MNDPHRTQIKDGVDNPSPEDCKDIVTTSNAKKVHKDSAMVVDTSSGHDTEWCGMRSEDPGTACDTEIW
jgi:hypothetical protein